MRTSFCFFVSLRSLFSRSPSLKFLVSWYSRDFFKSSVAFFRSLRFRDSLSCLLCDDFFMLARGDSGDVAGGDRDGDSEREALDSSSLLDISPVFRPRELTAVAGLRRLRDCEDEPCEEWEWVWGLGWGWGRAATDLRDKFGVGRAGCSELPWWYFLVNKISIGTCKIIQKHTQKNK